ncbi:MAG: serine/threonine protein kinase, partial [Nitrospinae bacterium]|nr:serine/threonine protein kinase [Nitrospinota bacterium]
KLEEIEHLGFATEGSRSLYNNLLAKSIALPRNLTTFAGYELRGEIGRGAMGVVYKAIQPGTKRDVALKIFSPVDDIARDPRALSECRQRFIQEAEITASFSHPTEHPNIIFIYHFDHYQGKPFYAMQYLAETLDKRLGGDEEELAKGAASGKTLPVSDSLNIIEQVCKGLKTVHEKGIVHRDIKPQNILFNDSGIVKIGDFGIAKRLEGISFTKSTGGFASAFYAAPDQESGFKDVDYRADIYSVSAVLYRMVTGRLPRGGFKPPHQINPEFPKEKSEAVMKGLSENPAERFTTITAFIQSLGLVSAGAAAEHKREKYKIAVEMVLSDGAITADEEKLLKKKRI